MQADHYYVAPCYDEDNNPNGFTVWDSKENDHATQAYPTREHAERILAYAKEQMTQGSFSCDAFDLANRYVTTTEQVVALLKAADKPLAELAQRVVQLYYLGTVPTTWEELSTVVLEWEAANAQPLDQFNAEDTIKDLIEQAFED